MNDCVAIAPTRGSAQDTSEPTARNFDWTPTPHCSASRSQATIEYVETIGSAPIRELPEVELEQVVPVRRDEHRRDLGSRQRSLDRVGGRGAGGDRRFV